jgi:hypothetical protein
LWISGGDRSYGLDEHSLCVSYPCVDDRELPFITTVFGIEVIVERVDMNESEEIVVVLRNGRTRQRVALLDLPLPSRLLKFQSK